MHLRRNVRRQRPTDNKSKYFKDKKKKDKQSKNQNALQVPKVNKILKIS